MRWSRGVGLALAVTLPACSETGVEAVDLVGTWDATRFEFEETTGDPVITEDLMTMNYEIAIEFEEGGTFAMTVSYLGVPASITGTWSLQDGRLILSGSDDPDQVWTLDEDPFDVTLSQSTLTIESDDLTYDFDHDGDDEPALFVAVFQKR
jgi:hypothetical protein